MTFVWSRHIDSILNRGRGCSRAAHCLPISAGVCAPPCMTGHSSRVSRANCIESVVSVLIYPAQTTSTGLEASSLGYAAHFICQAVSPSSSWKLALVRLRRNEANSELCSQY